MEEVTNSPEHGGPMPSNALRDTTTLSLNGDDNRPDEKNALITPSAGASEKLQDITNAALYFLSNASNETLGACAVGLCASTYLLLGRVGLVLIGAVGGVVLHATWEASNAGGAAGQSRAAEISHRRKELGIEIARRTLDWRDSNKKAENDSEPAFNKVEVSTAAKAFDYNDFRPATKAALTTLTDAIIRDYVK